MSTNGAHFMDNAIEFSERATNALVKHDKRLENAISETSAAGLPQIAISPLHGQFLAMQCRAINAKSVLEIGTLGGYSSIWFASAGAKVTSLEIDPKHRDVAMANTKGLDVEVLLGNALEYLPKFKEQGRVFDFVFIDADWDHQSDYFKWAVELTRKGGLIFVDNVARAATACEEKLVETAGSDKRVQSSMISTFTPKWKRREDIYDSFLMAIVL